MSQTQKSKKLVWERNRTRGYLYNMEPQALQAKINERCLISYATAANPLSGPLPPDGETALVLNDKTKSSGRRYLILDGDHRQAYEDIFAGGGSIMDLVEYWRSHETFHSEWSDDAAC